ncbi:MAG: amidohydrolase [Gracilibacteraceae bacterium]|jgi:aminobenzoyl-glutamate utilization protein B|nr:amidohydrolase [Gracilibacteraceae bacterium]
MSAITVVDAALAAGRRQIEELNRELWRHPEGAFEEYATAEILSRALEREGFRLEKNIAGLPTAFTAAYGAGAPRIAVLTDLDALPGLSQQAGAASPQPLAGQEYGHGCGHSAIGAGAFAAVLGAKAWLEASGRPGTIIFIGCPGEENGGGKTYLVRAGVFRDLACAFTWHPGDRNGVGAGSMNANITAVLRFKGTAAHAAFAADKGRSALDAAELTNVGVNYLREHIAPDARIHYAYLDAGGVAPNIVQSRAALVYSVRAPRLSEAATLLERVAQIARGAALMTETETEYEVAASYADYEPNDVLSRVLSDAFQAAGPPAFDEADFALARTFFLTLPERVRAEALATAGGKLSAERPLDTAVRAFDPVARSRHHASTDFGDVSYVLPTAQASCAAAALGTPLHSWQYTGQAGAAIADKAVLAVGKALALAAVKTFEDEGVLRAAWAEFRERREGRYLSLLPADAVPQPLK